MYGSAPAARYMSTMVSKSVKSSFSLPSGPRVTSVPQSQFSENATMRTIPNPASLNRLK